MKYLSQHKLELCYCYIHNRVNVKHILFKKKKKRYCHTRLALIALF